MSELATSETPPAKLRLGGMALPNGLLLHGPTHWAAAVRTRAGEVKAASGRKPRVQGVDGIPGVRGVVRVAESLAVIPLVKLGLPEARLPFQNASVIAAGLGVSLLGSQLRRRVGGASVESAMAVLSVAPALVALRGGELAAYHGVEHKAVAAYEQGIEDTSLPDKEHERCGSHLVGPLMALNLAGTLLLRRVVERPHPLAGQAISVASVAGAVEVFGWCERHGDSTLAQVIRTPGFALQRYLGTREPDEPQLEVGRAALAEILRAEA